MSVIKRKEHPLSMRIAEADISLIDRAANLQGRSRSDFVRDAAVRAAHDVLMESGLVRMSDAGFAEFVSIISAPPVVVAPMVKVLTRPAPWESKKNN